MLKEIVVQFHLAASDSSSLPYGLLSQIRGKDHFVFRHVAGSVEVLQKNLAQFTWVDLVGPKELEQTFTWRLIHCSCHTLATPEWPTTTRWPLPGR